jgi:small-conductance mechanosensitive channel
MPTVVSMYAEKLAPPLIVTGVILVVLLIVRKALFAFIDRRTANGEGALAQSILQPLRIPSVYWSIVIAVYAGIGVSEIPTKYLRIIEKSLDVLVVMSITFAVVNLAGNVFKMRVQNMGLPMGSTGLAYGMIKGILFILGFLVMLTMLGVSITPLVTALGVGGLAVALALQDTLANLFAGIHILMEKSIRVGDFVKLESGQEGYVEDITWRTTRIRMLANNTVVIPNSKLAQSSVTNYYLPEKRMSVLIPVSVSYDSDPLRVEQILIEEAKQCAKEVPGLLSEPEPSVRFIPGFGDSSLNFTLVCQVSEFVDQYLAQHELRKSIFRRFREEGIEIPFPQRTIHIRAQQNEGDSFSSSMKQGSRASGPRKED